MNQETKRENSFQRFLGPQNAAEKVEGKENKYQSYIDRLPTPEAKKESFLKERVRDVLQLPLGHLKTRFTWPADLAQALGQAEALQAIGELNEDRIAELKEKFPTAPWENFKPPTPESHQQAFEQASNLFPTQGNIERFLEEKFGIPLQAQTENQQWLRGIGMGTGIGGKGVSLPTRAVGGATGGLAYAWLREHGATPEQAQAASTFFAGHGVTPKVQTTTKASGLPVRRFEGVTKPTKVSPAQHRAIVEKVEGDVRNIIQPLILGKSETARKLQEDPNFSKDVDDLFKKVRSEAEKLPTDIDTTDLSNFISKEVAKRPMKGVTPSEYERSFEKEMENLGKLIPDYKELPVVDLLDQFRKNNEELGEYYEPSKSSASNRAKRDALLTYNRALAELFRKYHPNSEFTKLFDYTNKVHNEREHLKVIDEFLGGVFDGKIDYKKARKAFEEGSYERRAFEKILGKDGFKKFEDVFEDLLRTEPSMKNLKLAKDQGYGELVNLVKKHSVSKTFGRLAALKDLAMNVRTSLLQYPEFTLVWKNALEDFNKGNFKKAQEEFKEVDRLTKLFKEKGPGAVKSTGEAGKKSLEKVLEVNPKYHKQNILNEPTQYIQKRSHYSPKEKKYVTNPSFNKNLPLAKREWDKYFEVPFDKYSDIKVDAYGRKVELGKLKDLFKDPKLKKMAEEVGDVKVLVDPRLDAHGALIPIDHPTKGFTTQEIRVKPGLTGQGLHSVLAHEMTHALQNIRDLKFGKSRLFKRYHPNVHTDYNFYLRNLNEVNARKFQRWVDLPVNKYRKEVEKAEFARDLLKAQDRSKK
jgi:hypothetical protein